MALRSQEITSIIKQQIEQFGATVAAVDVGTVVEVGDSIARVHGLSSVRFNELLEFANGAMGMALNLEEDSVGVVVMGDYSQIKEGDDFKLRHHLFIFGAFQSGSVVFKNGPVQRTVHIEKA